MSGLDNYLAYAESHRGTVCAASAGLIVLIAWVDWLLPTISIGFLYLVPVLLCAGVLNTAQILTLAVFCGILREVFDPLEWAPGAGGRPGGYPGFAMTGLFVVQLNQRRRLLLELAERTRSVCAAKEMQVRILVETSRSRSDAGSQRQVVLANESARQILGFDQESIQERTSKPACSSSTACCTAIGPRQTCAPTWIRASGATAKSSSRMWLSTYDFNARLAAVVWDASENLRDREAGTRFHDGHVARVGGRVSMRYEPDRPPRSRTVRWPATTRFLATSSSGARQPHTVWRRSLPPACAPPAAARPRWQTSAPCSTKRASSSSPCCANRDCADLEVGATLPLGAGGPSQPPAGVHQLGAQLWAGAAGRAGA